MNATDQGRMHVPELGPDLGPVRQDVQNGYLILTLRNPPVNALGFAVRVGIAAGLDRAARDADITGVILRGEGRCFSAGADIREFGGPARLPLLPDLCRRIESFGKPVVAAMHGVALGGGLELGLAAKFRVGVTGMSVGLPEVNLGLLPGAGGTQRLPRLIGAEAALQMILGAEQITADQALAIGLFDAVVSDVSELVAAAIGLVESGTVRQQDGLRDPVGFEAAVANARRKVQNSGLPAKIRIVDCVEAALLLPMDQGLTFERAAFDELRASPVAAALQYIFLAERRADHPTAGFDPAVAVPVTHLGIWGAGAVAVGLVGTALRAGLKVTLCDPSKEALVSTLEAVGLAQESAVTAGRMTTAERDADWARLIPAVDPMAFAGAGAIILTDVEKPLIVDFARGLGPSIAVLVAGGVPDGAGRDVLGVVFAPQAMVEVAVTAGVSGETAATGLRLLRKMRLRPVMTGQTGRGAGIGARVALAGRRAAQVLIRAGVPVAQVARATAPFLRLPGTLTDGNGALMAIQDEAIGDRILAAMANEGARIVSENLALRPSDVDVIMVGGYGFARTLGGPMHQADSRGLMVLRRNLRIWAAEDAVWLPDPLFDTLIADGRNFEAMNRV